MQLHSSPAAPVALRVPAIPAVGVGMALVGALAMFLALALAGMGLVVLGPEVAPWWSALVPVAVFGPGAAGCIVAGMLVAARRCSASHGALLATLVFITPLLVSDPVLIAYGVVTFGASAIALVVAFRS